MQVDGGVMWIRRSEFTWRNLMLLIFRSLSWFWRCCACCVQVSVIGLFNWGFAWFETGRGLCGDMGATWERDVRSWWSQWRDDGGWKWGVGRWCREGLGWIWLVLMGEPLFGSGVFCWCFCLIFVWLFIFIFMACMGGFVGGISGFRVVSIALFTWCFVVVCGWTALGVRLIKQSTILCKVSPDLLRRGLPEKPHTQTPNNCTIMPTCLLP